MFLLLEENLDHNTVYFIGTWMELSYKHEDFEIVEIGQRSK